MSCVETQQGDKRKHLRLITWFPSKYVLNSLLPFNSLKLIRGSLDQVDQKAQITWVQPRVLSREQIGGLAKRLDGWVNKLNTVEQRIAPEVLISA